MERLKTHVGDIGSSHDKAVKKCDDIMRQDQSIEVAIHKQSDIAKNDYRIRLNASIDVARHLLNGALPLCGHDESENSFHRRHFLEIIKYAQNQNESVRQVILKYAPGNSQMVSPTIQKDIWHCFAQEVLKSILAEIGEDVFALLVDESSDVSKKEKMTVVLRYVDACGMVKERFVGLFRVKETFFDSYICYLLLVKSDLRNRIGDKFLSGCLISAIEKEEFVKVTNEDVINIFQRMKTRMEQI